MNNKEILNLISLFTEKKLNKLKIKSSDFEIEIEKNLNKPIEEKNIEVKDLNNKDVKIQEKQVKEIKEELEEVEELEEEIDLVEIKSPMVGVFYSALSPDGPSLVNIGDKVKKGDTLFIIEAMKMINEVVSPVDGIVRKINFKDEEVLEFSDVVMEIEENV